MEECNSSTQTEDCWLSTYGYIYMWPTCLPDTSDGSGMETTCTRTSARLVCVCQGTTSTVILSVVFVNVGQCGWSSGLKLLVMICCMFQIHSMSLPSSPSLITSCSIPSQPLMCHVSMWTSLEWRSRAYQIIFWTLLSLQREALTSIVHSCHTLTQETQSLNWDLCDTWPSAASVLC